MRGLGHRIEAAIAAHGNHGCTACHRCCCGFGGDLGQLSIPTDQQFALSTTCRQGRFNHGTFGIDLNGTCRGVDHKQQRRRRVKARGRRCRGLRACGFCIADAGNHQWCLIKPLKTVCWTSRRLVIETSHRTSQRGLPPVIEGSRSQIDASWCVPHPWGNGHDAVNTVSGYPNCIFLAFICTDKPVTIASQQIGWFFACPPMAPSA